jgi:demethylmenaquinone methyltransferase/2-methoxy-6-polyprenyl-1,4-benzoquinol methylase
MGRPADESPEKVVAMFSRLSRHYDTMNALMSFGAHQRWRMRIAKDLGERAVAPATLLDYGAGSGDFAKAVLRYVPSLSTVVLQDGSEEMLAVAGEKLAAEARRRRIEIVKSDALALPFAAGSFDLVTAGFILRNVPDLEGALEEMARILKPGGLAAVVEAFPERGWVGVPVRWYKRYGIPLMARIVVRDASAFQYLNDSIDSLPEPEKMLEAARRHGLKPEVIRRLSIGFVYGIVARKERQDGDE